MTAPVYLAPLAAPGDTVVLDGDEGRHAATVRRTSVGERVDLVDGVGHRMRATVTGVRKDSLELLVAEVLEEPRSEPRVTLVQALAKGGRDEQAVETSTEFGVDAVIPWAAARCVVRWGGKEDKARSKWQAVARAAAKQSRRSWVPPILSVHTTAQLASAIRDGGVTAFVCHEEGTRPMRVEPGFSGDVWIIVGPEGGITPEETAELEAAGARTVLLAPHVLRSATAGPYAIASLATQVDLNR